MARKPKNENAAEETREEVEEEFSRDTTGQGTDTQGQDADAAREEAVEGDEEDDAEDGEGEAGDGEDDPEADLAAMATTDHDADPEGAREEVLRQDDGTGLVGLAPARTAGQRAGIDPVDGLAHAAQASNRRPLPNGQTAHEARNVLDPTSGTANPGIVGDGNHSASGAAGMSDMSGNAPKPDPFASAGPQVRQAMSRLQEASRIAMRDRKRGHGYLDLKALGVNKAVMDALVEGGHVTVEERAGAAHMPETGRVYRMADHREPE